MRKLLAMACAAGAILLPALAHAQGAVSVEDVADTGDTAWILVSSAFVLMMAMPGLTLFYGGLVRAKGFLAVLVQVGAIAAVASVLWVMVGYTLAFGDVSGVCSGAWPRGSWARSATARLAGAASTLTVAKAISRRPPCGARASPDAALFLMRKDPGLAVGVFRCSRLDQKPPFRRRLVAQYSRYCASSPP